MSFVKKIWKNRISENPLRRTITNVTTGVSEIVDVTRYEGTVTQEGDAFSAANMNDLEQRIADAVDTGGAVFIAGVEATDTAENSYTIGQYLIYNSLLYRVIQAIAVGNSLVEGVNITPKKIADELSDHLVVNGTPFYFDYHDGEFGYNTSELRGADTFVPFKSGGITIPIIRPTYSFDMDIDVTDLSSLTIKEFGSTGNYIHNAQLYVYDISNGSQVQLAKWTQTDQWLQQMIQLNWNIDISSVTQLRISASHGSNQASGCECHNIVFS